MNYWDLRKLIQTIAPRKTLLDSIRREGIKEKGRKVNYRQFSLDTGEMQKVERLLDTSEINSFLEVSLRAQACPMPLNMDVWDGIRCPYACRYCFADYFKVSLYTSFFDNAKTLGLRHINVDNVKRELVELFKYRGTSFTGEDPLKKAISLNIPIRLGIRFEDFIPKEKSAGVSLSILRFLAEAKYPVMINTKSTMPSEPEYLKALTDNKAGSAIHITMVSSDEAFVKKIEPGAPSFKERVNAASILSKAGVKVVARIEPYMVFLNDSPDAVAEYIGRIKEAGVSRITFDTYSYSAYSTGIKTNFEQEGFDFDRMFLLTSDSQWLGSLLLSLFMDEFRSKGIQCSTFDFGNVPMNSDPICCEVGDWEGAGFNWGSGVGAIRFIRDNPLKPVTWGDFEKYVVGRGGFLSSSIRNEVKQIWNLDGNAAWFLDWVPGIEPAGLDMDGRIWRYNRGDGATDFRFERLKSILGGSL